MDLLWSDPTTNDAVQGVQPSPRGPGLVTFGPDRVLEFCKVFLLQPVSSTRASANGTLISHHLTCPPPPPLVLPACFCLMCAGSLPFLQRNDLQMIVRAHECVMDGFERFAQVWQNNLPDLQWGRVSSYIICRYGSP